MSNDTASDQLQHMWRTRPTRLPQRGHVAGVAAGIGYRYDVDPVLIRIAFVASTLFGGAGIVLYLGAWLVLSRSGDSASAAESLAGKGTTSESTTKLVVIGIAFLIALSALGPVGVGTGGSGLISLLAMAVGLWLLHQRRPEPPAYLATVVHPRNLHGNSAFGSYSPPVPGSRAETSAQHYAAASYRPPQFEKQQFPGQRLAEQQSYTPYTTLPKKYEPSPERSTVDLTKHSAENTDDRQDLGAPTPPSWDPLGVAPFAWDLPEPAGTSSPSVITKKPRSRWTASFLGLALLAAAVTAGVGAATGGEWATAGRVGGVALAVIAVGLILGAFMRKGYGLLVAAGPLAGFVVLASVIGPVDITEQNSGNQLIAPTSVADLEPSYTNTFGNVELDLGAVTLTEDRRVAIDVTFGNATITVPDTMNIDVECSATLGSTDCGLGGIQRGSAAADDAPVLTIDANATMGNIEVDRA